MIPFHSDKYVQDPEGALKIAMVTLRDLGPYTCQVYNGQGSASSWSVTLRAYGPVPSADSADSSFLQYIVQRPGAEGRPRPPVVQPTRPPYTPSRTCTL
jgi:hypothetical protein